VIEQKPACTSHFAVIKGNKIYYIDSGNPGPLILVFLLAARFSSEDWLSVSCLKLAADVGYEAYEPDLPGF
jgi:hypothetical protein